MVPVAVGGEGEEDGGEEEEGGGGGEEGEEDAIGCSSFITVAKQLDSTVSHDIFGVCQAILADNSLQELSKKGTKGVPSTDGPRAPLFRLGMIRNFRPARWEEGGKVV